MSAMRLERFCRERREAGQKLLVPYLVAGYPDARTSLELIVAASGLGSGLVEIGIPFSDPVADGPVIQRVSQAALAQGMTLRRGLDLARDAAAAGALPVVMTYLNPVLRLGFGAFAERAAAAGCVGVIVPDLSCEESGELRAALAAVDVTFVDLVAPTTPEARLARIAAAAAGYLYLVAIAGVTGTRSADAADLTAFVQRVRRHTDLPLCVGFGIDGPPRAREAAAVADGVIVGSAVLRRLLEAPDPAGGRDAALALLAALDAALNPSR